LVADRKIGGLGALKGEVVIENEIKTI